jgi:hypothetical protein
MDTYAAAPWRSSKATFTVVIVALHGWVRRHAAVHMGGLHTRQCRFWLATDRTS